MHASYNVRERERFFKTWWCVVKVNEEKKSSKA